MNYELAKELKEAGFSQKHFDGYIEMKEATDREEYDTAYAPTLEELIEACGRHFSRLEYYPAPDKRSKDQWSAQISSADKHDFNQWSGFTPTEAVARLWLALNKK